MQAKRSTYTTISGRFALWRASYLCVPTKVTLTQKTMTIEASQYDASQDQPHTGTPINSLGLVGYADKPIRWLIHARSFTF